MAISCLAVRQCLQTAHCLWVQASAGAWTSAWTNDWVIGLERPVLASSPFHLICFVPFQVCNKIGWIRHGLSGPTVRWRPKKQIALLAAWATDKPVSWVGQTVFTEVPNLLWLHIGLQSVHEPFYTCWACFGCLLKLTGFWKFQIMVPSYLFEKHSEKKEVLKNLTTQ